MGWLIVFVVSLVLEFFTVTFFFLSFVIGSIVAFVLEQLGLNITIQIIAFIVVSIISFIVIKPIAKKYLHKDIAKTNVDALIDSVGLVTEVIDNKKQTGAVKVNGIEYTARSLKENESFEVGESVIVRKIDGIKVIVEKSEN